MKKKIQKKAKTYSSDHVVLMLEDIRDQFKAFGDGQKNLENKFDGLADRFDKFDIRLSSIEDRVRNSAMTLMIVDGGLKELKRDVKDSYKANSDYLSRIEKEIQSMKPEIKSLKVQIKDKTDVEKVQVFEKKLLKLEKLVFAKLG